MECDSYFSSVSDVQGSAKRWALGCVNLASWLPLAAGGEFPKPRAHLLADPCRISMNINDTPPQAGLRGSSTTVQSGASSGSEKRLGSTLASK